VAQKTKEQSAELYISELRRRLRALPEEETGAAAEFYGDYFREAEDFDEAFLALGTPRAVAAQIIAEYAARDGTDETPPEPDFSATAAPAKKRGGAKLFWTVLLAVFAAPIALPVSIAVGAVLFSVAVTLAAAVFSLAVSAAACVLAGFVLAIAGAFAVFLHPATGLAALGSGLFGLGVGYLLLTGTVKLSKLCFGGLKRAAGRFILRRRTVK
jgi:uncharacterized membrane protein